jgi:hypothetical protein
MKQTRAVKQSIFLDVYDKGLEGEIRTFGN